MHSVSLRGDTDVQLMLPLRDARSFRQLSVLRSDTVRVELKKMSQDLAHSSWTALSHKKEIPDHCMSGRKFQGRSRMCLCGCALILVLGLHLEIIP